MARRPEPFVLWPVGPRPLLALWMDEAVQRGIHHVQILAPDRPTMLRDYVAGGDYWSCSVEVISNRPPDWPMDTVTIDHIPGHPIDPPVAGPAEMIRRWLDLNTTWIRNRPNNVVTIDRLDSTGGWIGPKARIHPTAILTAPFWIGRGAEVGARAQIGPEGLVGEACVIDEDAEIVEGAALGGTYVGQHVSLRHKLADGGVLFDAQRGCRVEIGEEFIIAPLADKSTRPALIERLVALALAGMGSLASLFVSESASVENYLQPRSASVALRTGKEGPLVVRRRAWLYQVAAGHWHLVGVLPRTDQSTAELAADVRDAILRAPIGVFSLADVHGCHAAGEPEEWVHALFQAVPSGAEAVRGVRRKIWKLAWTTP